MTKNFAVCTHVSPQIIIVDLFFEFAVDRMIECMTDLRCHCLCIHEWEFHWLFIKWIDNILDKDFLDQIPKMLHIKLDIDLELLFRWIILIFLKIRDEIIKNDNEIVFKTIITNETLSPDEEIEVSLRDENNSNRDVNESCGKENIQFIENILELCLYMKKLRFIII